MLRWFSSIVPLVRILVSLFRLWHWIADLESVPSNPSKSRLCSVSFLSNTAVIFVIKPRFCSCIPFLKFSISCLCWISFLSMTSVMLVIIPRFSSRMSFLKSSISCLCWLSFLFIIAVMLVITPRFCSCIFSISSLCSISLLSCAAVMFNRVCNICSICGIFCSPPTNPALLMISKITLSRLCVESSQLENPFVSGFLTMGRVDVGANNQQHEPYS